jgi:hypothetical protein
MHSESQDWFLQCKSQEVHSWDPSLDDAINGGEQSPLCAAGILVAEIIVCARALFSKYPSGFVDQPGFVCVCVCAACVVAHPGLHAATWGRQWDREVRGGTGIDRMEPAFSLGLHWGCVGSDQNLAQPHGQGNLAGFA